MRVKQIVVSLAAVLWLVGAFLFVVGSMPVLAQEPTVIGNFVLVKYVCSSDIGSTGSAVPGSCVDANDPNGANVPVLAAGSALSFLYEATYSCPAGSVCTPINPISVTVADNQLPSIVPAPYGPLQDGSNPGVVDPNDVWLFVVRGQQALNLNSSGLLLPGGGPVQGRWGSPHLCEQCPDYGAQCLQHRRSGLLQPGSPADRSAADRSAADSGAADRSACSRPDSRAGDPGAFWDWAGSCRDCGQVAQTTIGSRRGGGRCPAFLHHAGSATVGREAITATSGSAGGGDLAAQSG